MAKKTTVQNQDLNREERIYKSEKSRIEYNENSSKKRMRRRLIEGLGKIATGRRQEGVDIVRNAVKKRTEDNVRNTVERNANETIHRIEQERYGGANDGTRCSQDPPNEGLHVEKQTNQEQQSRHLDNSRQLPDKREGANGMTVDELAKLNKLKKTNPEKYNEEMKHIFGVERGNGVAAGEQVKVDNNEKHGFKL